MLAPIPCGAGAASFWKKFGKVFLTHDGFLIFMPGTCKPRVANAGTTLGEFGAQGADAFAFLDPEPAEIGEPNRIPGERREHDGGHDAVAEVGLAGDDCRQGQTGWKAGIDLPTGGGPSRDGWEACRARTATAEQPVSGPEITARRGIRFDRESPALGGKGSGEAGRHRHVGGVIQIAFAFEIDLPLGLGPEPWITAGRRPLSDSME
jgi:hypothetical protein